MLSFRFVALFLAIGCLARVASAEISDNYIFRRWDTENGLPENGGKYLLQTRDGYLWLGTGKGLVRFDGQNFTVLQDSRITQVANGRVTGLVEDRDGALWVGTQSMLIRYQGHKFEHFTAKDGLTADGVSTLGLAADGSVWVVSNAGISRRVGGAFVNDVDTTGVNLVGARAMTTDPAGTIWLATGIEVLRYVQGKFTRFNADDGLPALGIEKVLAEPDGNVVVSTQSGLFHFDGTRFSKRIAGLASERINVALRDRDGVLWVGSAGGLDYIEDGKASRFTLPDSVVIGSVDSLLQDREGTIWMAGGGGVFRLSRRRGTTWWKDKGLVGTLTLAVKQGRDGSIWISTWDGGLVRIQGDRHTLYRAGSPLSNDNVTCIYEAPDGSMWFGNRGSAVDHLQGERVTTYVYPDGVPTSRFVTAMHMDDNGDLLLGIASRGLFRLRGGQIEPVPKAPDLRRSNVWVIHRTRDRRLLLGTKDGIYQREADESWRRVPFPGIESVAIRSLDEDPNGDIWLSTMASGLIRWNGDRVRAYTSRDGLINDSLSGLVDDGLGSIWVSAAGGIARLRRNELDAFDRGEISQLNPIVLGRADGLLSASTVSEVGAPAAERLSDGRLLFTTGIGVAVISPRDLAVNSEPPTVVIESVLADGAPIAWSNPAQMVIPADTNRVEIRYTAPSLASPEWQRFRYRLVGSDPRWIEAGHARAAPYTHLAPGSYTFNVLACNSDGVWAKQPASLVLVIRPKFYQTLWFRGASIFAAIAVIGGAVGFRIRQMNQRQANLSRLNAELDLRVRERTAELSQSHAEVQQRELSFRLIFEHAPVGISWVRADQDARPNFNSAFHRIFRLPAGTLTDTLLTELTHPADLPRREEMDARIRSGELEDYTIEQRFLLENGEELFTLLAVAVVRDDRGRIIQIIRIVEDITPLKKAEQDLANTYKQLVDASRMAGMAEIATGVLHNVGNVLNSVNVSASLIAENVRASRVKSITKVTALLRQHATDLAEFLTNDPKGKQVLPFLDTLATHIADEQEILVREVEVLNKNVEHIKEVVSRQQSYAHLGGVAEELAPAVVFEDALRMNLTALARHGVEVVREFSAVPTIMADRHKVLQILVNLVQNAKQALHRNAAYKKRIVLRLEASPRTVRFIVQDNGMGIPPENKTRIFSHGFSTRSGGHGFGLHSSANAAKEMGGSLTAHSDGPGTGATFTLELPAYQRPSSVRVSALDAGDTRPDAASPSDSPS